MARAHFVKRAAKDYPQHGIKKGESYYWWKFRSPGGRGGSPKHFSKTPPKASQLTASEFQSGLASAQEEIEALEPTSYSDVSSFEADVTNVKENLENLKDETQGKFDNMPEGLQQGDTGQLLENRVSEVESLVSDFDGIDFAEPDSIDETGEELDEVGAEVDVTREKDESDDDYRQRIMEAKVHARIEEIKGEIEGFNWSIE